MALKFPPFVQGLAHATGIDPRVVMSWVRAEGGPANNPLNIGPGRHYPNPVAATAHLINTSNYYKGIRNTRGNPSANVAAIIASPWDAGHYANGGFSQIARSYGIHAGVPAMQAGGPTQAPMQPQQQGPDNRTSLLAYLAASNAALTGHTAQPSIASFLLAHQNAPQNATASSLGASSVGMSGGALGKVIFAKGADRPGVHTQPGVTSFAEQVAHVFGRPLTVGTGTNHNQFVEGTHRVSDHWAGNAVDIPMSGAQLTHLGQAALIAAGMPAAKARRQRGGLFNINGHQIIFNSSIGGNHYNHLHISAKG